MKDQPDVPKKMGPWEALGAFAILAAIVLAFVWGVAAAIKWV